MTVEQLHEINAVYEQVMDLADTKEKLKAIRIATDEAPIFFTISQPKNDHSDNYNSVQIKIASTQTQDDIVTMIKGFVAKEFEKQKERFQKYELSNENS